MGKRDLYRGLYRVGFFCRVPFYVCLSVSDEHLESEPLAEHDQRFVPGRFGFYA